METEKLNELLKACEALRLCIYDNREAFIASDPGALLQTLRHIEDIIFRNFS